MFVEDGSVLQRRRWPWQKDTLAFGWLDGAHPFRSGTCPAEVVDALEEAARHGQRTKLADIREGEYEGLAKKLADPAWQPDFGPATLVPSWGATVTGARMFLIAYNVNILGTPNQAHRIALNLRETGRGEGQPGPDGQQPDGQQPQHRLQRPGEGHELLRIGETEHRALPYRPLEQCAMPRLILARCGSPRPRRRG